jgi:hypothetical protein
MRKREQVRSMVFGYALGRYFGAQRTQVERALDALKPEHREVLELAHFVEDRDASRR